MYRRVLLAYDGSREGRAALREGGLIARRCGAQVFLLAVTPPIPVSEAVINPVLQPDAYDAILQEGLTRANEVGLNAVGQMVHGDPVEEISAFAKRINADLVVVGHRRKSFFERWWSGPTQALLIDNLRCSLLVAKNVIDDNALDAELRKFPDSQV